MISPVSLIADKCCGLKTKAVDSLRFDSSLEFTIRFIFVTGRGGKKCENT